MNIKIKNISIIATTLLVILSVTSLTTQNTYAATVSKHPGNSQCGSRADAIYTTIDFGCYGATCLTSKPLPYCNHSHSAIIDVLFAIIRFITDGVGLVIIASLIFAGIQYTVSRGDPRALKKATMRIHSSATALILFILAYAILNYIIPNGFFG